MFFIFLDPNLYSATRATLAQRRSHATQVAAHYEQTFYGTAGGQREYCNLHHMSESVKKKCLGTAMSQPKTPLASSSKRRSTTHNGVFQQSLGSTIWFDSEVI
jgi:hypothetical protein